MHLSPTSKLGYLSYKEKVKQIYCTNIIFDAINNMIQIGLLFKFLKSLYPINTPNSSRQTPQKLFSPQ